MTRLLPLLRLDLCMPSTSGEGDRVSGACGRPLGVWALVRRRAERKRAQTLVVPIWALARNVGFGDAFARLAPLAPGRRSAYMVSLRLNLPELRWLDAITCRIFPQTTHSPKPFLKSDVVANARVTCAACSYRFNPSRSAMQRSHTAAEPISVTNLLTRSATSTIRSRLLDDSSFDGRECSQPLETARARKATVSRLSCNPGQRPGPTRPWTRSTCK